MKIERINATYYGTPVPMVNALREAGIEREDVERENISTHKTQEKN